MRLEWWHASTDRNGDGDLTFTFKVVPSKFDEKARSISPGEVEEIRQRALGLLNAFVHIHED